jgi:hypothetical protein
MELADVHPAQYRHDVAGNGSAYNSHNSDYTDSTDKSPGIYQIGQIGTAANRPEDF